MLVQLNVKNLGIIEDLAWQLHDGLNVITGETGAGKSLMIEAVELLLSAKGDDVIRHGADEAQIEGIFDLPQNESCLRLRQLLNENGLTSDEDSELIISCLLRRKGSSIIRLNGHAVSRALLHQTGCLLADFHGQSEHLSLLDNRTHLNILDSYAHLLPLRRDFQAKVTELQHIEKEIKSLEKDEQERASRQEFLKFQQDEIRRANLQECEDEKLEQERAVLSSAEQIKELSYEVYRTLYDDDSLTGSAPAIDRLNEAVQAMKKLAELDASLKPQLESLEQTVANLTETTREIHAYGDRLNADPARLEEIESRLELIRGLKRKYGKTIAEILLFQEKTTGELETIGHSEERVAELAADRNRLKREAGALACQLSQERVNAAQKLITDVKRELNDLNMMQVTFEVSITQQPDPAGIPFPDGSAFEYNDSGADNVEFMASTNPGEPVKPLAKIASTGELSRFTLALKSALDEADDIPVVIFDEIDIGVGGRSGEIIGKKLWGLGRTRQVICVTHLPQIAAFADAHFAVEKTENNARTTSNIQKLDNRARVKEIAMMLSGPEATPAATKNATELLTNADKWKSAQRDGIKLTLL